MKVRITLRPDATAAFDEIIAVKRYSHDGTLFKIETDGGEDFLYPISAILSIDVKSDDDDDMGFE